MNGADTAIVIVIALSCAFGVWRGLVKEVLSLLIWIVALLVARIYAGALSGLLLNVTDNSNIRYVVAFTVIFLVVMILGTFLNHLMMKLLAVSGLNIADSILGGMFGLARGALIVLVALFISNVFLSETQQWRQSALIPYGLAMIEWSRAFAEDVDTPDTMDNINMVP